MNLSNFLYHCVSEYVSNHTRYYHSLRAMYLFQVKILFKSEFLFLINLKDKEVVVLTFLVIKGKELHFWFFALSKKSRFIIYSHTLPRFLPPSV